MQVLVCVINKKDCLESILENFINSGIMGATIIDSIGMARVLNDTEPSNLPAFGSIRMILNENRPFNKTIFVVLKDSQVDTAINCIKKEVGDINEPGIGILFTIPVNHVEGGMLK
ncbi:hypothetical protein [Maledivibacter halophilus]|uniref:Nitrogen regulatory protein P-II family n=1 Tax=Maledivibacter halophilus TaxID=36842 RepID=A0A1T5MNF6_9FIRM|nr:hypothetical protein [Maledivibacter halophilus]SKC89722.1 hypothetical protein SAMN02194393_05063 [Maledivibacter halophilus]